MTDSAEVLRHGDRDNKLATMPALDRYVRAGGVELHSIRQTPIEVHFIASVDTITMPIGMQTCDFSADSDAIGVDGSVAGQASFHPVGTSTYCRSRERVGDLIVVSAPPEFRSSLTGETGREPFPEYRQVRHPEILNVAQMIRRHVLAEGPGQRLAVDALALLAFSACYRGAESRATSRNAGLTDIAMDRVRGFIDENLHESFGLEDLARVAELSTFHFARSFKRKMGQSPHQFVMERRVERARDRLRSSEATVADIAYDAGFSSQSHMTDTFRKLLGTTPARYRREIRT